MRTMNFDSKLNNFLIRKLLLYPDSGLTYYLPLLKDKLGYKLDIKSVDGKKESLFTNTKYRVNNDYTMIFYNPIDIISLILKSRDTITFYDIIEKRSIIINPALVKKENIIVKNVGDNLINDVISYFTDYFLFTETNYANRYYIEHVYQFQLDDELFTTRTNDLIFKLDSDYEYSVSAGEFIYNKDSELYNVVFENYSTKDIIQFFNGMYDKFSYYLNSILRDLSFIGLAKDDSIDLELNVDIETRYENNFIELYIFINPADMKGQILNKYVTDIKKA